jgi:nucleotidyltransferase substrate binding protein (TIGR01987 family)
MHSELRWKQRFQNFSRAFQLLRSVFDEHTFDELNQLEQEGVIQRFEYTWELAWKTMKDFLEYHGMAIPPPTEARNVIKTGARLFFAEADIDGNIFMEMLEARNELSHTYNFEKFKSLSQKIQNRYVQQFEKLYDFLIEKQVEDE